MNHPTNALKRLTACLVGAFLCTASIQRAFSEDVDRCAIGGWMIGMPFPGDLGEKDYQRATSRFLKGLGTDVAVFRLKNNPTNNRDFVAVADGKVIGIAREINAEDLDRYYEALTSRFGDPITPGPAVFAGFGKAGKASERLTWPTQECGVDFYLVRLVYGIGTLVAESAAVVAKKPEAATQDDPLR